MTDTEEWIKDLSREKTLWEAYKVSRQIPSTPFNATIRKYVFPLLFVTVFSISSMALTTNLSRAGIEALSSTLITVSATILGFLVAGLAVFTTMSDKNVLIEMAKTKQRGTNITTFKYLFFNLISIFVVYIFILCLSTLIYTLCKISFSVSDIETARYIFKIGQASNGFMTAVLAVIFFESILCLKSFIWNLYTNFISILLVSDLISKR